MTRLVADYERRLQRHSTLEWHQLPPSRATRVPTVVEDETTRLLAHCRPTDFVVLLDERGQQMDSVAFAAQLENWLASPKQLVFVIGGAYGVSEGLLQRADMRWSLSQLVFPHQLVPLLLVEQLYRGSTIRAGLPYHHQ